jgi:predicted deacetylase
MKVAIRDDDVSFFTQYSELEKAYGRVWNFAPISFAVIPFVKDLQTNAYHPLGENEELLEALKRMVRKNQIEIMLHGYSHEDYENGREFEAGDDLRQKVEKGKKYLELLFEKPVRVFVPPHNALSKTGVEAVEALNMHILGSIPLSPLKRGWNPANLRCVVRKKIYAFRKRRIGRLTWIYPFLVSLPNHK